MIEKFGIEKVIVVFLEGLRILSMEENSKVVVFEKKEIALILLFVVVLIITSFTLGIRLGKKLGPQVTTLTPSEKSFDLKSPLEEDAEVSVTRENELSDEEKLKRLMDESKSRLSDELNRFREDTPTPRAEVPTQATTNPMAGKFTIQLGSYNTVEEARQFAEGFTVRGYSPILNEVVIPGKGKWYRVSLGLFETTEEAKAYIRQEQSLFAGQDHIITEIK